MQVEIVDFLVSVNHVEDYAKLLKKKIVIMLFDSTVNTTTMDKNIADLLSIFCKESNNYNLPRIIQSHIYSLEYLMQRWYNLNYVTMLHDEKFNIYNINLSNAIHKSIITLVEKISF